MLYPLPQIAIVLLQELLADLETSLVGIVALMLLLAGCPGRQLKRGPPGGLHEKVRPFRPRDHFLWFDGAKCTFGLCQLAWLVLLGVTAVAAAADTGAGATAAAAAGLAARP